MTPRCMPGQATSTRGATLERAAARVCQEAGATATHVLRV